jgi:integration host factor subunit alpha
MNRSELVKSTADAVGRSVDEVDQIINTFFGLCEATLLEGEKVKLRRWGVFELRTKTGHTKPNPRTGDAMVIPDRRTVVFLPSDILKTALNSGT